MCIYKTFVLILVILAPSLFVGCAYLKSEELSPEKKLELAQKCSIEEKKYFQDFTKDYRLKGYLLDEPEYHYSSRLNTCLIHIGRVYVDKKVGLSFHCNQVVDVFSNKAILYGWFSRDAKNKMEILSTPPHKDVPNYNSTRYFEEKNKLFSE